MKDQIKIWIDALEFKETGGWKTDTQYVHLMGCGYLLAANEPGVPVADAKTVINVPKKDTYRIWIRTRNWLRPHNPGRFSLLVNGEDNKVVLGAQPSDAWVWEIAGDFELDGAVELTVKDLTGYFGRFSSIVITNDFDFVPSREIERMRLERARIKGLDTSVKACGEYDVIVAGGGPGGIPAAIAAARKGMKTLLLHNRSVLGGNGSEEIGITFEGAGSHGIRETGIAEELRRLRDSDPIRPGDWSRALKKLVDAEENLTVIYNAHVCDVEMENETTIQSVIALDTLDLTKSKYTGKIFIDCTGDAWLGYYAGAIYRFGREAKHQHGENLAADIADTQTMSGCIRDVRKELIKKTDYPVEFKAPDWVPKLPETDEAFGRKITAVTRLAWWVEAPNTYDDMWDGEESRDALMLVLLGYYDHLKNHWSEKEKAKNTRFAFTSIMNGRRESRRLIGDYILTQNDCINKTHFEDVISCTGWDLDIHHPKGIYGGKNGPLYCARRVSAPEVPFRCLYSKNIDNLMFAGRNISTTHIAMGTTRVQNSIATFGQAVGTAAAMCVRLGETPRGIYKRHMSKLQQTLIKDDQYIPTVKSTDEKDPCLGAKATASSVCSGEIFRTAKGEIGELLPLNVARAADISYSETLGDVERVYVKLRSDHEIPTPVKLYIQYIGGDSDTFANAGKIIYETEALVPPMCESWVKFDVHIPTERNMYVESVRLRFMINENPGISWRSIVNGTMYQKAGEKDENGNWNMKMGCSMCASVTEPNEPVADCGPHNAINGYNRIVDADHYEWVSDPAQEMPQWLEVEFKQPTAINNVSVCFDTDLVNPGVAWGVKVAEPPKCIKDYNIEIFDGRSWIKIAEEKNNFMRKRSHRFETTTVEKLRVTALATWGDRSARIMEIRADNVLGIS